MSTAKELSEYPMYELQRLKAKLIEDGIPVYDFGTGDPKEKTPELVREAFIKAVPEVSQYPTIKGSEEFRKACAGWLKRRFNLVVDPAAEIIPLTGAKEGIFHITPALIDLEKGKDTIIAAIPGYQVPILSAQVFNVNAHVVELNEDNSWILDLADIPEEVLKRAACVWYNYPHNPTGQTVTSEFFAKQYKIAKQYNIVICSDETYVDLYNNNELPPTILETAREGVLAFHSCSKRSGMTGYRSGFLAGDAKLIKDYTKLRSVMGVATPVATQAAASAAWSDDAHASQRRDVFNAKREILEPLLSEIGIEFLPAKASFYIWCKTPKEYSSSEYVGKLLEKGIIVSPESHFKGVSNKFFRIALVPTVEDCKRAADIWRELV